MKTLIGPLFLVATGFFGLLNLPEHLRFLWFGSFVLPAIAISAMKQRRIILRFGMLTWTREELCRHVLITGDTGSGKTTSGFHPILIQVTKNEPLWGGLVLGVKGNEHEFITELFHQNGRFHDLVHLQVRPENESTKWSPPHRYNLVSDRSIPWMTHAKAIVDVSASMTDGSQHVFFKSMAQLALANAFELLEEVGKPVSISRAYELLTNREMASQMVRPFRRDNATVRQKYLYEFFSSTFVQAKAHEQREAVEGTIRTYLGFFMDADLLEVFSSDSENTFSFSQLERGMVISVSMPQRFQTERRYIQTYLKILFYYHVLRRFDQSGESTEDMNLLLLIADEFQDLVTATEDGISDHKIIDRIRSAGAGIIAGMQSEISADPAISMSKRKVLSLNMRSRFIFRAADPDGALASAEFIGKKDTLKSSRTYRGSGGATTTKSESLDYILKPHQLMNLRDHHAVIVHPSKRFQKARLVPRDGAGRRYGWY